MGEAIGSALSRSRQLYDEPGALFHDILTEKLYLERMARMFDVCEQHASFQDYSL